MQSKDITIGAEFVIVEDWKWKRGLASLDLSWGVKRVRVEAHKQPRKVWGRDSFRPHTKHDGILVTVLDTKTGQPEVVDGKPRTEVVTSREVRMAWEPFITEHTEAVEYARKAAAERLNHRQTVAAQIGALLGEPDEDQLPYSVRDAVMGKVYADGSYSREVRSMSLTDLRTLLQMAYDAGKASA